MTKSNQGQYRFEVRKNGERIATEFRRLVKQEDNDVRTV